MKTNIKNIKKISNDNFKFIEYESEKEREKEELRLPNGNIIYGFKTIQPDTTVTHEDYYKEDILIICSDKKDIFDESEILHYYIEYFGYVSLGYSELIFEIRSIEIINPDKKIIFSTKNLENNKNTDESKSILKVAKLDKESWINKSSIKKLIELYH